MLPASVVTLVVASVLGGPPAAGASAPHPPTYAANRVAAVREAKHLLDRAVVPAGSTRLSHAPKGLRRPASIPSGALVDRVRFWRVPFRPAVTDRWVRRHRPPGLTLAGWGSGGRYGRVRERDVEFDGRPTTAYASPELQLEIVRAPHGRSYLRADGMAQPLDPRPIRDTYRGHRTRITTRTGCPATRRHLGDVRNSGVQLRHHLLPAGRPTGVLLCAYAGLNGPHRFALRAHHRFGPRIAARLAHRVRSMSLAHVDGAEYHCPMDDGSADVVAFAFPGRPDVALLVRPRGCASADNGVIDGGNPFGQAVNRLLR